jgi:hypothetical protein
MKKKQRSAVWVVALLIAVLSTAVVHAVYVDIDTNDGILDPDWANTTPSPYLTDPDDVGNDNMDILSAYLGTNGPAGTDYLYFRVDVVSAPITGNAANNRVNALIDCNNNGVINDPTDLFVSYLPTIDAIEIRQTSNNLPLITYPNTQDGERPANGNSAEWRVLKSDLTTWGCTNVGTGAIRVQFVTSSGAAPVDTTALGDTWNSPTAVQLQDLQAVYSSETAAFLLPFAGLLTITAYLYRRRPRSPFPG